MIHRLHIYIPLALAITGVAAAAGFGAEKSAYHAVGAPAEAKVQAHWNKYHDYGQATELLQRMAAAYPNLAGLKSLGKSYGGREMWVLSITNTATGDDREKPAFFVAGAIHANEVQATEAALYTAWYLLEMYDENPRIRHLVDHRAFYIMPMMSPDSRDAHMHRPNSTHTPRGGQRPVDDDRDGLIDEDPPDDLDGDGHITMMRVRDPNGRWKPHPEYPNLMVRAEADQPGEFRLRGQEGFDNDGDGRVNEDGDGYYDPNRDWPWQWQPRHVQRGAYRYPLSVPENRLIVRFIIDHPNIAGAQSYHNFGGMVLRGPGPKGQAYPAEDVAVYDAIAKNAEKTLPHYRYLDVGEDLYSVQGGTFDWFYAMRGIFTFVDELFTPHRYFHGTSDKPQDEQRAEFDRYVLFGQGTVPWHEVDHPQYGKVEVGGWTKNWGRQPPSFLLEENCHRIMAFTLYHAEQMPRVEIQSVETRRLSERLHEVTAVVANPRLTPTRAAVDRKHKITAPDVVRIEGGDLRVVAGLISEDPLFEEAESRKRRPERLRVDHIPGMGAVYVRWLVEGEPPFRVTVRSLKGGQDSREVP